MENEEYPGLEMEVIRFETEDVIATSIVTPRDKFGVNYPFD